MNKILKALIFVLIFLTFTSCGPNLIKEGEIAPNFTLRNLEGEENSLKDYRGKAVLLNYELIVLAVNYGDSLNTVIDFTDDIGMTFSPLLDLTGDVQDLYIINGYPTSIFIDKDGVIQMVHVGYLDADAMDEYLELIGIGEGLNN